MERWTGVVNVSLSPTGPLFRVAASLLLSHAKTLNVPSLNAVFFNGDRVEGTGDPVVERLSEPTSIARSLVAKFGAGANAWVVTAPTFAGPFAVYRDFVPSVNSRGDPMGYDPDGFPASTTLAKILSRSVEEVKSMIWNDQTEPVDASMQAPVCPSSTAPPKTVVLGFSKGGSVVNQIIYELAHLKLESAENLNIGELSSELLHESQYQICPLSVESLLYSISEFHYVDVGLNCRGAYITNRDVIRKAVKNVLVNKDSARFVLHGTPRQWCNQNRPWICEEKDLLLRLLKEEACKYEGKLQVCERFYFQESPPSLKMHFEIIECMEIG
ncbi:UPF0565 protein C2orf69-like protein [Iris pallida]|uniref:UPF0565 protein C2orf69-like protein n=1 Tax=Iris pallida TaxID=29817 RepID=A0AAX6DHT3_IRIPA|nr:UPF0565 protein C2orf69-like protein [Iris pallida]